jgi:hypothetical protein
LSQSAAESFPDRLVDGDARVVDEDVQPAVLLDHLLDDALAVLQRTDVALMQRQVPPSASTAWRSSSARAWFEE